MQWHSGLHQPLCISSLPSQLEAKKAHFLELRKNPPKIEKKAAAPAATSNGSQQAAAQSDVSKAVSEASASGQKDSSASKPAEDKPLSNGAHAAEPAGAATEEETKSVSKGTSGAADGELSIVSAALVAKLCVVLVSMPFCSTGKHVCLVVASNADILPLPLRATHCRC